MSNNLQNFINSQKKNVIDNNFNNNWNDDVWDISNLRPHRAGLSIISFYTCSKCKHFVKYTLPMKYSLPNPYKDFVKAFTVYLILNSKMKYMAIRNKILALRYLHVIINYRNENSLENIIRMDFENVINEFRKSKASNTYDLSADLHFISRTIDNLDLISHQIQYQNKENNLYQFNQVKESHKNINLKIPSMEVFIGIVKSLQNPISKQEEYILNIILILISTGLRINEITHLPYDCLISELSKDVQGKNITAHFLKYFPEKSKTKVAFFPLPESDYHVINRSISRIKELTTQSRKIAKFHENNPSQIWSLTLNKNSTDLKLLEVFKFNTAYNLRLYMRRKGIKPISNNNISIVDRNGKSYYQQIYSNVHIYSVFLNEIKKRSSISTIKLTGLMLSEMLCIAPEGAFNFKRSNFEISIFISLVKGFEINRALGSEKNLESIFDRRNITEANGDRISITSHFKRHWRNTIYELAGMSNVNQALSMGRSDINQNKAYQHIPLDEKFKNLNNFTKYSSILHRPSLIKELIREDAIKGDLSDTYKTLLNNEGLKTAEDFLNTHAGAFHLTPFGGCTHDFSQSPCELHLECWNGCSNLHRTNSISETDRIEKQLKNLEIALIHMNSNMKDEYQNNKWIDDLESKITNLKKALKMKPGNTSVQVFPEGQNLHSELTKRTSSTKKKRNG